jgi:hypothetical protein
MKAPSQSEASIQQQIVSYLRAVAPHCLTFAVPNASRRTSRGSASNAVAGLTPGIPDLCIIGSSGTSHFIEVKTDGGCLSHAQEAIRLRLIAMAVPYCVARSVDDVRTALAHWNIETKEHAE